MALRRIGKYYGEDDLLLDLIVQEVLPLDYEDVTDLCMIMKLELKLNWLHEDCVTLGNEYVNEVGEENLKPHELPFLEQLN
jgi:hypothetical protein